MVLKTETINGLRVEFGVHENGRFSAVTEEHGTVNGDTLAEVRAAVTKIAGANKRSRQIEATVLDIIPNPKPNSWDGAYTRGDGLLDVTLRGYSERTRDVLVTIAGKKQKLDKSYVFARRLTTAERQEYETLTAAYRAAVTALEGFKARVAIDVKTATMPPAPLEQAEAEE